MNIFERRQPYRREFSPFSQRGYWNMNPFWFDDDDSSEEETYIPIQREHSNGNPPHYQPRYNQPEELQCRFPRHNNHSCNRPTRKNHPQRFEYKKPKNTEAEIPIAVFHEPKSQTEVSPVSTVTNQKSSNDQQQPIEEHSKNAISEQSDTNESEIPVKSTSESSSDIAANKANKLIEDARINLDKLEEEVDSFQGSSTDKTYLRLEHELTNKLLTLDKVTAFGASKEDEIRSERKAIIKRVQAILDKLESRVES